MTPKQQSAKQGSKDPRETGVSKTQHADNRSAVGATSIISQMMISRSDFEVPGLPQFRHLSRISGSALLG
jgi:hypothetical protein